MQEYTAIEAVIYIGASSVQMLIGRLAPNGLTETVNEYSAFSVLSRELSRTRRLTETGMDQTMKVLGEMHRIARENNVREIRVAASCCLRNAENRDLFLLKCMKEFGKYPLVLGENDEARFNFIGASEGYSQERPLVVVYVGFNNIHIAYGTVSKIESLCSLQTAIAPVNRFFGLDHRTAGFFSLLSVRYALRYEFSAIGKRISQWYKQFRIQPELLLTGPFTTIYVSLHTGQPILEGKELDAIPHTKKEIAAALKKIAQMSPEERKKIPGISNESDGTLVAGLSVIRAFMETSGFEEFRISQRGLCSGILKTAGAGTVI